MRSAMAVVAAVLLAGTGCGAEDDALVVGSKKFTESVVLGEILTLSLRDHGLEARHRAELGGTRILYSALVRGDVDLYPEYTGTIAEEIFGGDVEAGDHGELRRRLAEQGVGMSEPLGFDNAYVLATRADQAERLGIERISDLRDHPDLVFGFSNEFLDRPDGWRGLSSTYALDPESVRGLDHDLAYRGIAEGEIDVIDAYGTDAEIAYHDLATLSDDRGHFPEYEGVVLYRRETVDDSPAAGAAIAALTGRIDAATMREMNRRVKIGGEEEHAVAAGFLGLATPKEDGGRRERLLDRTVEHLLLVAVSLGAAIVLAVPLGIVAFRRRRFGQLVLGAVGIVQTIPSLALLVFMIPLLGIGTMPAIAALFLYSLLPIVRNTHAGLADVDRALRESALSLGMTPPQMLRLVELPLALRSILAGIKTAAVINVGVATLGALIGAGGYGQPILTGIRLDDLGLILEGAIPAALLALVVQWLFDGVERLVVSPGLRSG